jgi:hypothetical protein
MQVCPPGRLPFAEWDGAFATISIQRIYIQCIAILADFPLGAS